LKLKIAKLRSTLEEAYCKYNDRKLVDPDPLQFLYNYENLPDREIVGLIASCLAYGRVQQICSSVSCVLDRLPDIRNNILKSSDTDFISLFDDFKHRFTSGGDIAIMLFGVRRILESYGSLQNCFMDGFSESHENVIPALDSFVGRISDAAGVKIRYLLPSPSDGSACKRLNLYLKWMVRYDNVDPGGWNDVSASKLVIPVDIHIHRICANLGFTSRKTADLKTALEITDAFRKIAPDDPVRYDFALTRMGMWDYGELELFYKRLGISNENK
jgi:uncharacterized protein (TIGR02757 family)